MLPRLARLFAEKMAGRTRWTVEVDRAVLLAHDLPRAHRKPWSYPWLNDLPSVCTKLGIASAFDEVWLVSFVSPFGDPDVTRVDNWLEPEFR